jgi:AcrR family transcriptional regulator
MARPVNAERRQELVDAAATHLVRHGLANTSLDDIAASACTSARMLVHHFGSRDRLIAQALEVARRSQLTDARSHFVPAPDAAAVLEASWSWLVDPESLGYFRLFQQVAALERLGGAAAETAFKGRLGTDWEPMLVAVFAADRRYRADAASLALLAIAVYRGIALDLVASPDDRKHRDTFDRFIRLLRQAHRPRGA